MTCITGHYRGYSGNSNEREGEKLAYQESRSSRVQVELCGKEIRIGGEDWFLRYFTCEVECSSGFCSESGKYGEAEIDEESCEALIERETGSEFAPSAEGHMLVGIEALEAIPRKMAEALTQDAHNRHMEGW